MQQPLELTKGAGKRQRTLLFELYSQGEISMNRDNGLFSRNGFATQIAKDLLTANDKTLDEQIRDLEPTVLRLEEEAYKYNIKISGSARRKLEGIKQKQQVCYERNKLA